MRHGHTQDLTVDIGEGRSYPIRFVQDAKEVLAKLVTDQANSSGKLAVITDMNLQLAHPELFEQLLKEIPITQDKILKEVIEPLTRSETASSAIFNAT